MKNTKGFSLIELVVAIVIMGIAFYALINVFMVLAPRDIDARTLTTGTHLMNRKMEEVMLKSFPAISSESVFSFAAPFNSYSGQVVVNYVTTADVNTVSASPTPYKRVKVQAWGLKLSTIEVVTLAVTYEIN